MKSVNFSIFILIAFLISACESEPETPEQQIARYSSYVKKDEGDYESYYKLGMLHMNQKQYDKAADSFRNVVRKVTKVQHTCLKYV